MIAINDKSRLSFFWDFNLYLASKELSPGMGKRNTLEFPSVRPIELFHSASMCGCDYRGIRGRVHWYHQSLLSAMSLNWNIFFSEHLQRSLLHRENTPLTKNSIISNFLMFFFGYCK